MQTVLVQLFRDSNTNSTMAHNIQFKQPLHNWTRRWQIYEESSKGPRGVVKPSLCIGHINISLKKKKKNRTSKHKNTHSRAENNLGRRKLYFKYFKGPTVFKDNNKLSLDKR